ncbi:tRNA-(ms[2]io[6]A)-hydroxylase [Colwellia sp. MB02u-10]|uniref:tRNA isopentenyl-2-thiomethyl-A-37 hydroxylase MiaE n=1 Tax=unclassified Colwellia TaxID=196834 RepID=UPI0015F7030C|nr:MULTISPECIES: tRNA isopentenyl-2-thiomethyl-A-37 hydroxylase MiaE [unclassified Colwellia]MBA6297406.1 tRNA-(ms[2]io[6]A)-hydroxylase [Colwellia sp. MB02u-9]MBA6341267.1 tRNA-(ms[2]io[6]A)-hydroxylase [Colwellia sp. MB02u-10]
MTTEKLLAPIKSFLKCETPQAWLDEAAKKENLSILLIDHLICELKAAQSAMFFIRKYVVDKASGDALLAWLQPFETLIYKREGDWRSLATKNKLTKSVIPKANSPYGQSLIDKMVLLIKEELHHFYQVLEIMDEYGVEYRSITPCRYAKGMLKHVKTFEPDALIDKLIVGAYIEARSCERFAMLAPLVDKRLGDFYISLLRSEARHYQDYLTLAKEISGPEQSDKVDSRIAYFAEVESQLIISPDNDFKFHSGAPSF